MRGGDAAHVKEYEIDGNTAIDDLVFAGLHAQMDQRVLKALETQPEHAPTDPEVLKRALAKANAMLAGLDVATELEEGLELMSSTSSSAEEDDEDLGRSGVERTVAGTESLQDLIEDGECGTTDFCSDDMMADKILALPPPLVPTAVPVRIDEDEVLMLVGNVVNEVEDMVTIRAAKTGRGVWDLASICCDRDRYVVGYIIDTMGQTEAPFYVVQRLHNESADTKKLLATGTEIYTTAQSTFAAIT